MSKSNTCNLSKYWGCPWPFLIVPVSSSSRSASVDFPWSTCAIIEKLRILSEGYWVKSMLLSSLKWDAKNAHCVQRNIGFNHAAESNFLGLGFIWNRMNGMPRDFRDFEALYREDIFWEAKRFKIRVYISLSIWVKINKKRKIKNTRF